MESSIQNKQEEKSKEESRNWETHLQAQQKHLHIQQKLNPCKIEGWGKAVTMDEYLLCNALNRDISPPSSLPTALICLPMAWQISLPAAICAFSPSKPPRVARSMKDTQRREYTASTWVCVARG